MPKTLVDRAWPVTLLAVICLCVVALPSCRSLSEKDEQPVSLPMATGNLWASIMHDAIAFGGQKSKQPSEKYSSLKYILDFKRDNSKLHSLLQSCVGQMDASLTQDQKVTQLVGLLSNPQIAARDPYNQSRLSLLRGVCLAQTQQLDRALDAVMEAEAVDENKDWRIALQLAWLYQVTGEQGTSNAYYQKAVAYGSPPVPQSPY